MITRIILAATLALISLPITTKAQAAETYTFDPTHTNITWFANHFGFSNPSGRFGIKSGTLTLDETAPEKSNVDVTIDVAGLTTGIEKFDEHLKSADFLDTAQFPLATFKSTKVELKDKENAIVTGDFTLHGVTKPVSLNMKLNKIGENPIIKKKTAGFSGDVVIKRSEFGISQYVPSVSDEITIRIEAEANISE